MVHLSKCECCRPNPGALQTSGLRPLKRSVSVCFQTNSGVVRMIYECNMNQKQEVMTRCDAMRFDGAERAVVYKTKGAEDKRGATRR